MIPAENCIMIKADRRDRGSRGSAEGRMDGVYRLAGCGVMLSGISEEMDGFLRAYRDSGNPEIRIAVSAEDTEAKKQDLIRRNLLEQDADRYPDLWFEKAVVHEKVSRALLAKNVLLIHGSAIAWRGQCCIFCAPSGTGKSTHTRLWREMLGDGAAMVNDDKPYVRIGADGITVYGSPYDGKHHLSSNIAVPLKAVCFLSRAAENTVEKTDFRSVFPRLIESTYLPETREETLRALNLLEEAGKRADVYTRECNMRPEAAETAFRAIFGTDGEERP